MRGPQLTDFAGEPQCNECCEPDPASNAMTDSAPAVSSEDLRLEVAEQIVLALNLEVAAAEIEPDAPLYGDGLGLDSIDILEVALVLSKRYGFTLRSDNQANVQIFASLASLSDFVAENRSL